MSGLKCLIVKIGSGGGMHLTLYLDQRLQINDIKRVALTLTSYTFMVPGIKRARPGDDEEI